VVIVGVTNREQVISTLEVIPKKKPNLKRNPTETK